MNADMRRIADDYLTRLRRSMRGASADVVREAELEIQSHIDDGLAALPEAGVGDLLDLLERLGAPEEFGRDMALYLMVDRGYRDWSLPHMLRSTLFWGVSTLTGATVILIFALLFAWAAAMTLAEAMATRLFLVAADSGVAELLSTLPGGASLIDFAVWTRSPLWILLGPAVMALLALSIRWFVGQYVRRAEPYAVGEQADGARWRRYSEKRILKIAGIGLGIHLVTALAGGIYRFDEGEVGWLGVDFTASPLAFVSAVGLLIFLVAPLLGVLNAKAPGSH